MRYALGVLAGILSGLVFTASSIAQKKAIDAIGTKAALFGALLRSPLWLSGFALAFLLGAPLNMASYMAIGPTLPPALASLGLAAAPILARAFLGERPALRSTLGAASVAVAVACLALSGLSIAPEGVDWLDRSFLLRALPCLGCVALAFGAFFGLGSKPGSSGTVFLALAAGTSQALSNALMAPIAGQLGLLVSGGPGLFGWVIAGIAGSALAAVNFGAIAVAQLALRRGAATLVIPLQQLPVQMLPVAFHLVLYRGGLGGFQQAALLGSGLVLLLLGFLALEKGGKAADGGLPTLSAGP